MSEKKKRGCLGCLFKGVVVCIAGALLLAVVLVATIPLWFGSVSTGIANAVVPAVTGTAFNIDEIHLNPWTGSFGVKGVNLSNPDGFGSSPAFSLTSFNVKIAPFALFSNTLHIKDLTIQDAYASYYSHDGANNIDTILANVEKNLGIKDKEEEEEEEEKPSKKSLKIKIDHLLVSGTKVKLMETDAIPPIQQLMDIELSGIGVGGEGATLEDAWQQIAAAFMKSMNALGGGFDALAGFLGDGAGGLADTLGDATKGVTESLGSATKGVTESLGSATKGASESLGNAAKSTQETLGSATESIGDGAKSVSKSVGNAAKSVSDTLGDGAKAASDMAGSAVDAVGDTAQKATEGVKNLFKGFGK